jgi:hypothetical protein
MFYDNLSIDAPIEGEKVSVQVEHLIDITNVDMLLSKRHLLLKFL